MVFPIKSHAYDVLFEYDQLHPVVLQAQLLLVLCAQQHWLRCDMISVKAGLVDLLQVIINGDLVQILLEDLPGPVQPDVIFFNGYRAVAYIAHTLDLAEILPGLLEIAGNVFFQLPHAGGQNTGIYLRARFGDLPGQAGFRKNVVPLVLVNNECALSLFSFDQSLLHQPVHGLLDCGPAQLQRFAKLQLRRKLFSIFPLPGQNIVPDLLPQLVIQGNRAIVIDTDLVHLLSNGRMFK